MTDRTKILPPSIFLTHYRMMTEEIHPSKLNIFQQYRRTVKFASTTSRLKNKDWYRDALALDVQIHCYIKDDGGASCFLHVVSSDFYEQIGTLNPSQLTQYSELEKFVNQTLFHEAAKRAKSLGIILYLADEMSIASLGPEHENPGDMNGLRTMMVDSPKKALDDKTVSVESHAWRLFPYAGASEGNEFATAVAVSRKYEDTLRVFREIGEDMNLPIMTEALCAPLCAIASMPWFSKTDRNGTVAVLNYDKFTLLAFFNSSFDLMLLRYMPHSNGAKVPANIGPAVLATAAAFELEDPAIQLLPLSGQDVDPAIISLQSSMMGSEIMLVDISEIMKKKNLPENTPLEMLVSTQKIDPAICPLAENETFSSYQDEEWHLQDFLAPSRKELELHPGAKDIKLLKLGRRAKMLAAVALVGVVLYSGFDVWKKMASPAWLHKPNNSASSTAMLNEKVKQYGHWNNLLKGRSKGWVSMELVTQMIPNDGSVILKEVDHQVTQKPEKDGKKLGFKKEWNISGLANDAGLKYLAEMNTRQGVQKLFSNVAKTTGNSAYLPSAGKRNITVTLEKKNNSANPGSKMKYAFSMVITQTFASTDDMAIAGIKPVTKKK